ncbi:hypothetical protein ILYODFUR_032682 [Ilyodon furcidens]|uniref:Uncharacterized protein n=1 Tax=Ilyodon furcidens TaxID=33524 RepID=A0ABV0TRN1_9TELE
MNTLMLEHGVHTTWIQIREAIPPNHTIPGVTVVSHVGIEVLQQNNGNQERGTMQHPRQGHHEGLVLCITTRPVGRNNSQRPVSYPKVQGCNPLVHRGKLQHETTELGGPPQPAAFPHGHSRVEESPTSLEELGSRAHTVRGGEPNPLCTGPSWLPLQVVGPLSDGLASFIQAWPGRMSRGATQPPGTLQRVPTPGLAPGWDPGSAIPGDFTCLNLVVFMKAS